MTQAHKEVSTVIVRGQPVVLTVEVTPRFLDTSGSYFGLDFPPGNGRHVAES